MPPVTSAERMPRQPSNNPVAPPTSGLSAAGTNGHSHVRRWLDAVDQDAAAAPAPAVELRGVRKRLDHAPGLAGADLEIPEGSISVVLGPVGAGKTLLLKAASGLVEIDAGEVWVGGHNLDRMRRSEVLALRRETGVMFQEGGLFNAMSVYENIGFPLRQHRDLTEREVHDLTMDQVEALDLTPVADLRPRELSRAQRKLVSFARSVILEPRFLWCDEPDREVPAESIATLITLLRDYHRRQPGGTVVVLSRDLDLARRLGDHVAVLLEGRVVASGRPDQVLGGRQELLRRYLSGKLRAPAQGSR